MRRVFIFIFIPLVFLTTIGLFYIRFLPEIKQRSVQLNRPLNPEILKLQQRPLDTSSFSKQGYIVPLENNATGSIYSSRAQLRGVVDAWGSGVMTLAVAREKKVIKMPVAVKFYCFPKHIKDQQGNDVDSSMIWMDLTNAQNLGVLTDSPTLSKKFSKGSDMTLLVNVGNNDEMTAYFIAGFGCSLN